MARDLNQRIAETVATIRRHWSGEAEWGVILGSGLGRLAEEVDVEARFDYADLPHFPRSTALGHAGRLLLGSLEDRRVCVMQGRFHLYEGWAPEKMAFPLYVMRALGAQSLMVSNASGAVNPSFQVGDLMVIDDHVNLMFRNPLAEEDRFSPGIPTSDRPAAPTRAPYDRTLANRALHAARVGGFACHRGVYVGMLGPAYETRAEYRMLRRLGGDVAGMSTVPEVIVAARAGMRVLGVSTITNVCSPDLLTETSGEAVVQAADSASRKLRLLLREALTS